MRGFLLLLMFVWVCNFYAQNQSEEFYDSARRIEPRFSKSSNFLRNQAFNLIKDSSMIFLNQYDRIKRENIAIQSLGDVAMPYLNLKFQNQTTTGFQVGMNPYQDIFFYNKDAMFYNAKIPFTEFRYVQGAASAGQNGMIDFNATHTQNIGERFNFSAKYHSASNVGFYKRQKGSVKNLQVSSYYSNRQKNYTAFLIYSWNKSNTEESGGLVQTKEMDTIFRKTPFNFRQLPVSLNEAKNINKHRELEFGQVYWILRTQKDSSFINRIGVLHSVKVQRQFNQYLDANNDFDYYNNVYYGDSKKTNDSMVLNQISNDIQIFTPTSQAIGFKAGITHDYIKYNQFINLKNFHQFISNNLSLHGALNFDFLKIFKSEVDARYFFYGYNQNDYLLNWSNQLDFFNKTWQLKTIVSASSRTANYIQTYMLSNHYKWNNNFDKINYKNIGLSLSKKTKKPSQYNAYNYTLPQESLGAGLNYFLVDGFIYFDENNLPKQGGKGQNVIQFDAFKHFNFKKFQIRQEICLQELSNQLKNTSLLPTFMSKSSVYYRALAFKKSTFIQTGFDVYYTNNYRANRFNPALQNFVNSSQTVGAYPYVDLFFQAEVKTARIFIVMEHINQVAEQFQGDNNFNYQFRFKNYFYASPFMASAPRRFRLGFVWKFFY